MEHCKAKSWIWNISFTIWPPWTKCVLRRLVPLTVLYKWEGLLTPWTRPNNLTWSVWCITCRDCFYFLGGPLIGEEGRRILLGTRCYKGELKCPWCIYYTRILLTPKLNKDHQTACHVCLFIAVHTSHKDRDWKQKQMSLVLCLCDLVLWEGWRILFCWHGEWITVLLSQKMNRSTVNMENDMHINK